MSFTGADGKLLLAKIRAMQMELDSQREAELGKNRPPEYGDDCEHKDLQDHVTGVPVCMKCGIEFPERRRYANSYDEIGQYNTRYDSRLGCMIPDPEPYVDDTDSDITVSEDDFTTPPIALPKKGSRKPRSSAQPTPVPTSPKNVRDLRKMASAAGIPKFNKMSKDELCKVLGVEIEAKTKPDKYVFTNTQTGEEHRFHSIYKAAKDMGINPGSVKYYLGREITIGDKVYSLKEL